jgi:hypothetical protein
VTIADIAGPLRAAGLTVVELPGWSSRGESDGGFTPLGVIWHHDGEGLGFNDDPTDDNNVADFMSQNGNNGAQLWIRRDGVVHLLAAGRKWHAGIGSGFGQVPANDGNTFAVGIETDHTFGNPWPSELVDAVLTTSAVLGEHYGWSTQNMCGHKEYAPDRKPDPESIDCGEWRRLVDEKRANPLMKFTPNHQEEEEMALTTDDVDKIADAVIMKLTTSDAVVMETYDDAGNRGNQTVSFARALQSAQVQAVRAARRLGA